MDVLRNAWNYIQENMDKFIDVLQTHLILSFSALFIAMVISIPLGIVCAKYEKLTNTIMNIANSLRVIPSLAILVIVLPILGTGFIPALVALTVLACPPILINTFVGFRGINKATLEAASGMGMNHHQILGKIEFPLAMPLVLTGCRIATVEVVASATLAAFIGGGGLGTFIINGLSMYRFDLLLVGAIPVALMAIISEIIFAMFEKVATRYQTD